MTPNTVARCKFQLLSSGASLFPSFCLFFSSSSVVSKIINIKKSTRRRPKENISYFFSWRIISLGGVDVELINPTLSQRALLRMVFGVGKLSPYQLISFLSLAHRHFSSFFCTKTERAVMFSSQPRMEIVGNLIYPYCGFFSSFN